MKNRKKRDDAPVTHFTIRELEKYIDNSLFSTNKSEEAIERTDRLRLRWLEIGLITEVSAGRREIQDDSTCYRFRVSSNKRSSDIIEKVVSDYRQLTIDFHIGVVAKARALDEFSTKYGDQASFEQFS